MQVHYRQVKTPRGKGWSPVAAATLVALCLAGGQGLSEGSEGLLGKIDANLSPSQDFSMRVSVVQKRPGQRDGLTEFLMISRGRDRTLLKTLRPQADRGRNILYLGRDVWVYLPSVRRPFQVSLNQRLAGEVSNGDIALSVFERDYEVSSAEVQDCRGQECLRLELKRKDDAVPYPRAVLQVKASSLRPVLADYYAASGRLLKRCRFEEYRDLLGTLRPTRLVLEDGIDPARQSIITYSEWASGPVEEKLVTLSYIDKMKY